MTWRDVSFGNVKGGGGLFKQAGIETGLSIFTPLHLTGISTSLMDLLKVLATDVTIMRYLTRSQRAVAVYNTKLEGVSLTDLHK